MDMYEYECEHECEYICVCVSPPRSPRASHAPQNGDGASPPHPAARLSTPLTYPWGVEETGGSAEEGRKKEEKLSNKKILKIKNRERSEKEEREKKERNKTVPAYARPHTCPSKSAASLRSAPPRTQWWSEATVRGGRTRAGEESGMWWRREGKRERKREEEGIERKRMMK